MARGLFHGSLCWMIPNLWFGGTHYDKTTSAGAAEDFWVSSYSSFCAVVIVVMIRLLIELQRPWAGTALLPTLAALLALVVISLILGYTSIGLEFQPNMEDIPSKMFE